MILEKASVYMLGCWQRGDAKNRGAREFVPAFSRSVAPAISCSHAGGRQSTLIEGGT